LITRAALAEAGIGCEADQEKAEELLELARDEQYWHEQIAHMERLQQGFCCRKHLEAAVG
jgi:hypothetical protein